MPTRVFIANRGEIAIRIARTLLESGYVPVGIYEADDVDSLHRRFLVDDVQVSSYLNIREIVNAAVELGAEAVHPGYGFLSENPEFAREVTRKGLVFIGPSPNTIAFAGDKLASKIYAEKLEVPTLPWMDVQDEKDVVEFTRIHGYPVVIKAAGGGGGRGIRIVRSEKDVETAIKSARAEAERAFKDARLYVEPYIENAKHIEVQILGDGDNIVHLYERECSLQRRFQKVIEEAPSPSLTNSEKQKAFEYAITLAKGFKYTNAGTVEFVFDVKRRELYFMEINARLQVEHPVTEMVTRVDIVKKQVEVALYSVLDLKQGNVECRGHAIEARIYAENPYTGEPSPGVIKRYREPGGPGIRVDSGVTEGSRVSDRYDPLIAKVIAWGPSRQISLQRLENALREYVVEGISTNIPLLKQVIRTPWFTSAEYTTRDLERELHVLRNKILEDTKVHAIILSTILEFGDAGAKVYLRKEKLMEHLLRKESVSSIKRRAWYYYVNLKSALERYYSGKKHHSHGKGLPRKSTK